MRLKGSIRTLTKGFLQKPQKTKSIESAKFVISAAIWVSEWYLFIISSSFLVPFLLSLLFSFCPFPLFSYSRQMQCSAALERGKSLSYFCPPNLQPQQHILTQLVFSEYFRLAENIKTWKSVTRVVLQNKLCQKFY